VQFSLDWLLQLCPVDREVDRIADALTARGLTVDAVEARGSNHVLDLDIPANRPDCLGHLGVARELGAAFGADLAPAAALAEASGETVESEVRVEILDPGLCPRYTAGVIRHVRVGPSPAWVIQRLEACGLRSVSNVVDVSNLVMLELGQPIHFFDLDRLQRADDGTRRIGVRSAAAGETLRTLDGVERRLDPDTLLITDAGAPAALAGVIGGADTEIGPATRHVLVEAAHFDPRSVRATARRLGLQTDASYRFERRVDPEAPLAAQALAARLLHELAAGKPAPGLLDVHPSPAPAAVLSLRPAELRRLLGFEPDGTTIGDALTALSLSPETASDGAYRVRVPSWRADLEREADLVEEVARHLGYDQIPSAGTPAPLAPAAETERARVEDLARDILAHLGFHEAVGYAMIGEHEDDRFVAEDAPPALVLSNPIAEPLSCLRRSVLPGLLRAVDLNLRRGGRDLRLFEVGRVFMAGEAGGLPGEPLHLGIAWSGAGEPRHWSRVGREVDLYDLTGLAEHVLSSLRPGYAWTPASGLPRAFHPGRSLRWTSPEDRTVAWGGALHPELQGKLDQELFLLEIDLGAVATLPSVVPQQRSVPRVPAVTRDLSLVLSGDVAYHRIEEALRTVEAPAPARFAPFDRYEGPPLAEGEVALTLRVTLEPQERTLTDPETEAYRQALVDTLERSLGIRLRS